MREVKEQMSSTAIPCGCGAPFRGDLSSSILRALESMPPHLREVFSLRHYKGASEAEIADKLGLGHEGEARALLRQADRLLYKSLRALRLRKRNC